VELLLQLAVHVGGRGSGRAVGERALVDARRDGLAGAGDGLDEQPQVGVDAVRLLPADQELRERDAPNRRRLYITLVAGRTTRSPPPSSRRRSGATGARCAPAASAPRARRRSRPRSTT